MKRISLYGLVGPLKTYLPHTVDILFCSSVRNLIKRETLHENVQSSNKSPPEPVGPHIRFDAGTTTVGAVKIKGN